jgi:hypothetical protein
MLNKRRFGVEFYRVKIQEAVDFVLLVAIGKMAQISF